MSPAKALALSALFVAVASAQADWKEFRSSDGNFRVLFPDAPKQQMDAERNLHQFSAAEGAESYGLAYADYPPGTAWENAVNRERDSILKTLGGAVMDEKPTSVDGYPGKWTRFVGQNTSGELTIYFVGLRLYVLHSFAPKSSPRPVNFSTFLNSFRLLSKPKERYGCFLADFFEPPLFVVGLEHVGDGDHVPVVAAYSL